MEGCFMRFYLQENQRCHGRPAWEWLLEEANRLGVRGGSAFRAMAGFGHRHHLTEEHFFELAGQVAVEVEFVVTEAESAMLISLLQRENLRVFYARVPATFGLINPDASELA